jgi:hypothetical protein
MIKPVPITKPVLLIGEGRDEEFFFTALVEFLGLSSNIQVTEYGGKSFLKGFLSVLTAVPPLQVLGITRDADNDYAAALASVNAAVQSASFPAALRVETFILPKTDTPGALEALVLEAVIDSPVWSCVKAFASCVTGKISEPFSAADRDKHHLQAWLSALPRPGLRLGEAARAGHIPFGHPAFLPITDFVKSLVSATENRSPHA